MCNWSATYDQSNIYYRQQTLCKTLSGNDCPLLTITSLSNSADLEQDEQQTIPFRMSPFACPDVRNVSSRRVEEKSFVVLTARVHPGESNASWVMKGIIDYLLSEEPTARILRDRYIFKVSSILMRSLATRGSPCLDRSDAQSGWSYQWMVSV